MGKGGNAPSAVDTRKSLVTERQEKIAKAPQFYWASGDALEEPHVARYVLFLAFGPYHTMRHWRSDHTCISASCAIESLYSDHLANQLTIQHHEDTSSSSFPCLVTCTIPYIPPSHHPCHSHFLHHDYLNLGGKTS